MPPGRKKGRKGKHRVVKRWGGTNTRERRSTAD